MLDGDCVRAKRVQDARALLLEQGRPRGVVLVDDDLPAAVALHQRESSTPGDASAVCSAASARARASRSASGLYQAACGVTIRPGASGRRSGGSTGKTSSAAPDR